MSNILEMAEMHLLQVQRDIRNLEQQKTKIEDDLQKLTIHLQEGATELAQAKSKAEAELADSSAVPEAQ